MPDSSKFQEALIENLPKEIRKFVAEIFNGNNIITKEISDNICSELKIDIENLMIMLLPLASEFAVVPVSNYRVGAVVLAESGNIYLGANMEFEGKALNISIHAEQSAVNNVWLNGEKGISKLAVTSAPCGHCRQFLNELVTANDLKILLQNSESGFIEIFELQQLLPNAFGPEDLNVDGGLFKEENQNFSYEDNDNELLKAAIESAEKSYAPYSKNYAGISLMLSDGRIIKGRYAENAAYNPSLSPLHSALAFLNMNSELGAQLKITDAVLAETNSVISQKELTETLLSRFTKSKLSYYKINN